MVLNAGRRMEGVGFGIWLDRIKNSMVLKYSVNKNNSIYNSSS